MTPSQLLKLNAVSAGYEGRAVLTDVGLDVKERDFIGIIGPNGGGKTTLLRLIMGLISPMSGSITYYPSKQKLTTGYLPQINPIDKKFPIAVFDVVKSGLMSQKRLLGGYDSDDKTRIINLLERTGIARLAHTPVGQLSGGQLQRVLLCRALVASPQLLLLDEPSTYVDAMFEKEFYDILHELNSEMAILMVSHDAGTIIRYVKSVACVNGRLYHHPSHEVTNELLEQYHCPIDLVTHGRVPHRVLIDHKHAKPT